MKKQNELVIVALFLVAIVSFGAHGGTLVSIVGDIDDFHGGDAADVPYRSQILLDSLTPRSCPYDSYKDLDVMIDNWSMGFTHAFTILPGQVVKSATLTIGVYSVGPRIDSASIMLDINVEPGQVGNPGPFLRFSDLAGYSTPSPGTTAEFVIDLSQAPMRFYEEPVYDRSVLPELLDGEFNIWGLSDTGIDYSILEIEIISDECSGAIPVELNVPYNGSTDGATGVSVSSCGYKDTLDVWHSFVPLLSGEHTISLCDSSFDTTLSVFDECGGTELNCSDDTEEGMCSSSVTSQLSMLMNKDTTYYIRIAGHNGQTGDYALTVTGPRCVEPIKSDLNDDCTVNFKDFALFISEWLQDNIEYGK